MWFHEVPLPVALVGRYVLEPRWLRMYADIPTLTVSTSSAESLRAYGLRNLAIVPEGVELPAGLGVPAVRSARPVLAFCGRLVSAKRPDHAIAAFAGAAERLGGAELHVIGTGPLEAKLRRSLPAGVVLHGSVGQREKFETLGAADALLCTSRREGWGLVVSEAAAVGTPTIGYDVAGLRDSVSAARGVIVEPRVDAMADAIAEWVPQIRRSARSPIPFGGASSWDHVASEVLGHLERAVAGARIASRPRAVGRRRGRSLTATAALTATALAPTALTATALAPTARRRP